MQCAACDEEIPDSGAICRRCNAPDPAEGASSAEPMSYHSLALTVRRLKGLVLASLMLGIVIAPFALYIASRAVQQYSQSAEHDPAMLRQLVQLRRLAAGLLIAWAFVLGGWAASLLGLGAAV